MAGDKDPKEISLSELKKLSNENKKDVYAKNRKLALEYKKQFPDTKIKSVEHDKRFKPVSPVSPVDVANKVKQAHWEEVDSLALKNKKDIEAKNEARKQYLLMMSQVTSLPGFLENYMGSDAAKKSIKLAGGMALYGAEQLATSIPDWRLQKMLPSIKDIPSMMGFIQKGVNNIVMSPEEAKVVNNVIDKLNKQAEDVLSKTDITDLTASFIDKILFEPLDEVFNGQSRPDRLQSGNIGDILTYYLTPTEAPNDELGNDYFWNATNNMKEVAAKNSMETDFEWADDKVWDDESKGQIYKSLYGIHWKDMFFSKKGRRFMLSNMASGIGSMIGQMGPQIAAGAVMGGVGIAEGVSTAINAVSGSLAEGVQMGADEYLQVEDILLQRYFDSVNKGDEWKVTKAKVFNDAYEEFVKSGSPKNEAQQLADLEVTKFVKHTIDSNQQFKKIIRPEAMHAFYEVSKANLGTLLTEYIPAHQIAKGFNRTKNVITKSGKNMFTKGIKSKLKIINRDIETGITRGGFKKTSFLGTKREFIENFASEYIEERYINPMAQEYGRKQGLGEEFTMSDAYEVLTSKDNFIDGLVGGFSGGGTSLFINASTYYNRRKYYKNAREIVKKWNDLGNVVDEKGFKDIIGIHSSINDVRELEYKIIEAEKEKNDDEVARLQGLYLLNQVKLAFKSQTTEHLIAAYENIVKNAKNEEVVNNAKEIINTIKTLEQQYIKSVESNKLNTWAIVTEEFNKGIINLAINDNEGKISSIQEKVANILDKYSNEDVTATVDSRGNIKVVGKKQSVKDFNNKIKNNKIINEYNEYLNNRTELNSKLHLLENKITNISSEKYQQELELENQLIDRVASDLLEIEDEKEFKKEVNKLFKEYKTPTEKKAKLYKKFKSSWNLFLVNKAKIVALKASNNNNNTTKKEPSKISKIKNNILSTLKNKIVNTSKTDNTTVKRETNVLEDQINEYAKESGKKVDDISFKSFITSLIFDDSSNPSIDKLSYSVVMNNWDNIIDTWNNLLDERKDKKYYDKIKSQINTLATISNIKPISNTKIRQQEKENNSKETTIEEEQKTTESIGIESKDGIPVPILVNFNYDSNSGLHRIYNKIKGSVFKAFRVLLPNKFNPGYVAEVAPFAGTKNKFFYRNSNGNIGARTKTEYIKGKYGIKKAYATQGSPRVVIKDGIVTFSETERTSKGDTKNEYLTYKANNTGFYSIVKDFLIKDDTDYESLSNDNVDSVRLRKIDYNNNKITVDVVLKDGTINSNVEISIFNDFEYTAPVVLKDTDGSPIAMLSNPYYYMFMGNNNSESNRELQKQAILVRHKIIRDGSANVGITKRSFYGPQKHRDGKITSVNDNFPDSIIGVVKGGIIYYNGKPFEIDTKNKKITVINDYSKVKSVDGVPVVLVKVGTNSKTEEYYALPAGRYDNKLPDEISHTVSTMMRFIYGRLSNPQKNMIVSKIKEISIDVNTLGGFLKYLNIFISTHIPPELNKFAGSKLFTSELSDYIKRKNISNIFFYNGKTQEFIFGTKDVTGKVTIVKAPINSKNLAQDMPAIELLLQYIDANSDKLASQYSSDFTGKEDIVPVIHNLGIIDSNLVFEIKEVKLNDIYKKSLSSAYISLDSPEGKAYSPRVSISIKLTDKAVSTVEIEEPTTIDPAEEKTNTEKTKFVDDSKSPRQQEITKAIKLADELLNGFNNINELGTANLFTKANFNNLENKNINGLSGVAESQLIAYMFDRLVSLIGTDSSVKNINEKLISLKTEFSQLKSDYQKGIRTIENGILLTQDKELKKELSKKLDIIKSKFIIFDNIDNNWDYILLKVKSNYEKYSNIDIDSKNGVEQDEQDVIYGKSNAEILPHESMTSELKRFMKRIRNLDSNGNVKKGVFGVDTYINFTEVLNTVVSIIAGENSSSITFEEAMENLNKFSSSKPWLKDFIARMNSSDKKVQNMFMNYIQKHNMSMKVLVYGYNKRSGGFSIKVFNTNDNKLVEIIEKDWLSGLNASDIVKEGVDSGIIDSDKVKNLRVIFDNLKIKYQDRTDLNNSELEEISNWLEKIGISIPVNALSDIMTNGLLVNSARISWKVMFNDSGKTKSLFGGLMKALESDEYKEISIKSPFNAVSTTIRAAAKVASIYSPRSVSLVFMDGGKMLSGVVESNYATDRISELKNNDDLLFKLLADPYSSESMWLKLLDDDPLLRESFNIEFVGLTSLKKSKQKIDPNSKYTDISNVDKHFYALGLFQNMVDVKTSGKYNRIPLRMSRMLFPAMSDKEQMLMMHTPVLDIGAEHIKFSDTIELSQQVIDILYEQLVLPELNRLVDAIRNNTNKNIEGLEIASKMFLMFPELNNIMVGNSSNRMRVLEKIKTDLSYDPKNDTAFINEAKKLVVNSIINEVNSEYDVWKAAGIIEDKNNNVKIKMLDTEYMKKFSSLSTKNKISAALTDYVINDIIAKANLQYAVIGDIASYASNKMFNDFGVDRTKIENYSEFDSLASYKEVLDKLDEMLNDGSITREEYELLKDSISPEIYLPQSNDSYKNILKSIDTNYTKRMALLLAPGTKSANSKNQKFQSIFVDDVIAIATNISYLITLFYSKEEALNAKDIIDSITDTNKKSKVKLLKAKFPKIADYFDINATDGQEFTTLLEHINLLYNKGILTEEQYKRIKEAYTKGEDIDFEDLKIVLQPIKPVTTGFATDNEGRERMIYIKSSSFPLIPQLTRGFAIDNIRTKLEAYEKEVGTTVRLTFGSATKVGFTTNPISYDKLLNPDNKNFIDDIKASSITIDRNNLRFQQDVPVHSMFTDVDNIALGSQLFKLLFGDGVTDIDGFEFNGKKLSGKQLLKIYDDTFGEIISESKKSLYSELGLGKNGEIKDQEDFMKNISNLIKKEAIKRGYPQKVISETNISFITDSTTGMQKVVFSSPLWLSTASVRLESLLNSIVRNRILKLKVPGYSFVVGSQAGFEITDNINILSKEQQSRIIFTDKWDGESLKAYGANENENTSDEYNGIKIEVNNNLTDNVGRKVAAKYKDNIIKLDRDFLKQKFEEKAWTNMRELIETIDGKKVTSKAENLPIDSFNNYEEFEQFVIEHEYQHSLYSRKNFNNDNPNSTVGAYETEINNRALNAIKNNNQETNKYKEIRTQEESIFINTSNVDEKIQSAIGKTIFKEEINSFTKESKNIIKGKIVKYIPKKITGDIKYTFELDNGKQIVVDNNGYIYSLSNNTKYVERKQQTNFSKTENKVINKAQIFVKSLFRDNTGKIIDLFEGEGNDRKYVIKDSNGKWKLKNDIDPDLLNNISFRIPTSSHVSSVETEIAGFLPPEVGDLMIVPKEFAIQKGLDYDVDKEYVYQLSSMIANGKITPVDKLGFGINEINKILKETRDKIDTIKKENSENERLLSVISTFESTDDTLIDMGLSELTDEDTLDYLRNGIQESDSDEYINELFSYYNRLKKLKSNILFNRIIRIHHSILGNSSPEMQKKINAVLSMEHAKEQANIISSTKDKDFDTTLFNSHQIDKVELGAVGKMGIGVYSNAVTLNSVIQQNPNDITAMELDADDKLVEGDFSIGNYQSNGKFGAYKSLLSNNQLMVLKKIIPSDIFGSIMIGKYNVDELNSIIIKNIDKLTLTEIKLLYNSVDIYNEIEFQNGNLKSIVDKIKNNEIKFDIRSISEILGERQNTATDNAKVEIMGKTNINSFTIGAETTMILLGFDKGDIIKTTNGAFKESSITYMMMSQPAIKELVQLHSNETSKIKGKYVSKEDIIDKVLQKYNNVALDYSVLTAQNLYDALSGNIDSELNDKVQKAALLLFSRMDKISTNVLKIQMVFGIGTKGLGKTYSEAIVKYNNLVDVLYMQEIKNASKLFGEIDETASNYNRSSLVEKGYIDIDGTMIKPTTAAGHILVNAIVINKDLWNPMLIHNSQPFVELFDQILENSRLRDSSNVNSIAELQTEIIEELKKKANAIALTRINSEFSVKDINNYREKLFQYTEDTIPLAAYLHKLMLSKDPIFANNEFLTNLSFEIDKSKNGISRIIFNNQDIDLDSDYIVNEIKKLAIDDVEFNEDFNGWKYSTRELAIDLVKYALISGGEFTSIGIAKYIPFELLEILGINSYLRLLSPSIVGIDFTNNLSRLINDHPKFGNFKNSSYSNFFVQYFQHNPSRLSMIARKDINITGGRLKKFNASNIKNSDIADKLESLSIIGIRDELAPKQISVYLRDDNGDFHLIPTAGSYGFSEYSNDLVAESIFDNHKFDRTIVVKKPETKEPAIKTTKNEYLDLLSNNEIKGVLEKIISNSSLPKHLTDIASSILKGTILSDVLSDLTSDTKFMQGDESGEYSGIRHNINIDKRDKLSLEDTVVTILHEIIHGITYREITANYITGTTKLSDTASPELKRLNDVYEIAKKYLEHSKVYSVRYATKSLHEFVAELLLNKNLINSIRKIQLTDDDKKKIGSRTSIIDKLKRAFLSFLSSLGITINSTTYTLYNESVARLLNFIDSERKVTSTLYLSNMKEYLAKLKNSINPIGFRDRSRESHAFVDNNGRNVEFVSSISSYIKVKASVDNDGNLTMYVKHTYGTYRQMSQEELNEINKNYANEAKALGVTPIEVFIDDNTIHRDWLFQNVKINSNANVDNSIINFNDFTITTAKETINDIPLKPDFKGKIIYAYYGLGKTFASKNNATVLDSDDITKAALYSALKKANKSVPKTYQDINIKDGLISLNNTDKFYDDLHRLFLMYTTKGYTVLTSTLNFVDKADIIIHSNNIDRIVGAVGNRESNKFTLDPAKAANAINMIEKVKDFGTKSIILNNDKYVSNIIFQNNTKSYENPTTASGVKLQDEQIEAGNKITNWIGTLKDVKIDKNNFISDTINKLIFLVSGAAGTGKTFTIEAILNSINKIPSYYVAPTHQAVGILQRNVSNPDSVITLQSLLGTKVGKMITRDNTGKDRVAKDDSFILPTFDELRNMMKNNMRPKIFGSKFIVLDEVSQVGFEPLSQVNNYEVYTNGKRSIIKGYDSTNLGTYMLALMKEFNLNIPIIMIGDTAQTVPVGTPKDQISKLLELVIEAGNYSELKKVRRTSNNKIQSFTNMVREFFFSIYNKPLIDRGKVENILGNIISNIDNYDGKSLIKLDSNEAMISKFVDTYSENISTGDFNPMNTTIINYNKATNPKTVELTNKIRRQLFGDNANNEVNENELIILKEPIEINSKNGQLSGTKLPSSISELTAPNASQLVIMPTDSRLILKNIKKSTKTVFYYSNGGIKSLDNVEIYTTDAYYNDPIKGIVYIKGIEFMSKKWINEAWVKAKKNQGAIRKGDLYKLTKTSMDYNYSYVVNNYKVQGSSIDIPIVDADNILKANSNSVLHIVTYIYTAISRSTTKMYVKYSDESKSSAVSGNVMVEDIDMFKEKLNISDIFNDVGVRLKIKYKDNFKSC